MKRERNASNDRVMSKKVGSRECLAIGRGGRGAAFSRAGTAGLETETNSEANSHGCKFQRKCL